MTKTLHATPLSPTEFTPYGGVISTKIINSQTITVNNGASRRTPEVVPTSNLYASAAPSGKPGRTVLNASLASPRTVEPWMVSDGEKVGKRVLKVNMLERHPFTTQSFVPMGGKVLYLVVVTSTVDGIVGGKPDLSSLKAFIAREEEGVCYGVGVWHAPMAVIDQPVNFAVIQHVNGVADEDCEFFPLEEELEIVF